MINICTYAHITIKVYIAMDYSVTAHSTNGRGTFPCHLRLNLGSNRVEINGNALQIQKLIRVQKFTSGIIFHLSPSLSITLQQRHGEKICGQLCQMGFTLALVPSTQTQLLTQNFSTDSSIVLSACGCYPQLREGIVVVGDHEASFRDSRNNELAKVAIQLLEFEEKELKVCHSDLVTFYFWKGAPFYALKSLIVRTKNTVEEMRKQKENIEDENMMDEEKEPLQKTPKKEQLMEAEQDGEHTLKKSRQIQKMSIERSQQKKQNHPQGSPAMSIEETEVYRGGRILDFQQEYHMEQEIQQKVKVISKPLFGGGEREEPIDEVSQEKQNDLSKGNQDESQKSNDRQIGTGSQMIEKSKYAFSPQIKIQEEGQAHFIQQQNVQYSEHSVREEGNSHQNHNQQYQESLPNPAQANPFNVQCETGEKWKRLAAAPFLDYLVDSRIDQEGMTHLLLHEFKQVGNSGVCLDIALLHEEGLQRWPIHPTKILCDQNANRVFLNAEYIDELYQVCLQYGRIVDKLKTGQPFTDMIPYQNKILAVQEQSIVLVDPRARQTQSLRQYASNVNFSKVSATANGFHIATGSLNGVIRTFDIRKLSRAMNNIELESGIKSLQISPSCQQIVVGYARGAQVLSCKLWNGKSIFQANVRSKNRKNPIQILEGHENLSNIQLIKGLDANQGDILALQDSHAVLSNLYMPKCQLRMPLASTVDYLAENDGWMIIGDKGRYQRVHLSDPNIRFVKK